MELSIKRISEGGTFMADFKKVEVVRCHYVNAVEERVEKTSILSNATATILRVSNNGTIFIQVFDNDYGREFPLAQFRITSALAAMVLGSRSTALRSFFCARSLLYSGLSSMLLVSS